ncbi:MAG: rhodanese-like domain-containing protein [Planctomycetota bacterium]|nr:rhodanese-like domain-containing protein [Planctomycetota bacterium]
MEITALSLAILALLAVYSLSSKLDEVTEQLDRLRKEGGGSSGRETEELAERVGMNSRFLARLAAGEYLMPSHVREGHLWVDVSPEQAKVLVQDGIRVLDVRTPQETGSGIIPGAILIPVDDLPRRADELPRDHAPTLVYCAAGVRSAAACQYLTEQGYDSLVNLDGGFGCWNGEKVKPA